MSSESFQMREQQLPFLSRSPGDVKVSQTKREVGFPFFAVSSKSTWNPLLNELWKALVKAAGPDLWCCLMSPIESVWSFRVAVPTVIRFETLERKKPSDSVHRKRILSDSTPILSYPKSNLVARSTYCNLNNRKTPFNEKKGHSRRHLSLARTLHDGFGHTRTERWILQNWFPTKRHGSSPCLRDGWWQITISRIRELSFP